MTARRIEDQDFLPSKGADPMLDEVKMRAHAVIRGIPITTTLSGVQPAIEGLRSLRTQGHMEVRSLQEYHEQSPTLNTAAMKDLCNGAK